MLFIYYKPVNYFLRTIVTPFKTLIPERLQFLINGTFSVKIKPQTSFKIVLNPTSPLGKELFWGGVKGFEYDSVRIFMELAKSAKVFFDVGANVGYYSLVATSINKDIKVYAFEPMPGAIYYFYLNLAANNFTNIKIIEAAVSDVNKELQFTVVMNPKFSSEPHHLKGDSSLGVHDQEGGMTKVIEVKSIRLDDYAAQNNIKNIDLLKVDAEASEHLVFEGSKKILKSFRPIIQCEVLHNHIESELEKIFKDNSYAFFMTVAGGLKRVPTLSDAKKNKAEYYFVPLEKIDLVKEFIVL